MTPVVILDLHPNFGATAAIVFRSAIFGNNQKRRQQKCELGEPARAAYQYTRRQLTGILLARLGAKINSRRSDYRTLAGQNRTTDTSAVFLYR